LNNTSAFKLIVFWYFTPFLLLLFNDIFLPKILFIIIIFLFGLFLSFNYSKNKIIPYNINIKYVNFLFLSKIIIYTSLILTFYGLIYFFFIKNGKFTDVRLIYYNKGSVFNSNYLFTFYEIFLTPLIIIALPYVIISEFDSKKYFIFLSIIFIICNIILKQGRFQILFLLTLFLFFNYYFNIKKINFLYSSVLFFIFSLYIFLNRQIPNFYFLNLFTSNNIDYEYLAKYTINYQFYGYLILNSYIDTNIPFGHPYELNTPSFIFFIFNTFIFTKFFGFNVIYPWEIYNLKLSSVGMYASQFNLKINAFSTNFYPLFLDGGYLYIFIYGLISGLILGVNSESKFIKILKFLNFYVLIFGLYQPVITFFIGFIFQILIFILLYYILRNNISTRKIIS
jgi:hypothetical protein